MGEPGRSRARRCSSLYRAAFFYGTSRWIAWTIWAHVVHHYPYDLTWGDHRVAYQATPETRLMRREEVSGAASRARVTWNAGGARPNAGEALAMSRRSGWC